MKAGASKLLAEWFWTDRWMGSSGFLLPMLARGVYREMLTQAWRRGAQLPNDHQAIQRAIGATPSEWAEAWPLVSRFWRVDLTNNLVNDTQLSVYAEAKTQVEKNQQRALIASRAAQAHRQGVRDGHLKIDLKNTPPSPSPSPSPITVSVSVSDTDQNKLTREALAGIVKPVTIGSNGRSAQAFETFWRDYPRKEGRAKAEKAWKKIRPDRELIEIMTSAVEKQRQTAQWQDEDGRYVPSLGNWLTEGRWQDQLPENNNGHGLDRRTRENMAAAQRFASRRSPA